MSRIYLRSNTLILWLSLSAAVAASAVGVGCSSSSDSGPGATAGKGSSGATSKAGSGNDAGDPGVGGGETGEGGSEDTPAGGTGGTGDSGDTGGTGGGTVVGGSTGNGEAGERGEGEGEGGKGGSATGEDPEIAAAKARGLAAINTLSETRICTKCHQDNYQGGGFYPNITPDEETGIGTWTLEDIKTAIRDGKDKDKETLCLSMERYTFTDAQLSDIAVYLKHLPPVAKKVTAKCPG